MKSQYQQKMEEIFWEKFDTGSDFTISDVWNYLVGIFHFPGNTIVYVFAQVPSLETFFEIDLNSFNTITTGAISAFCWLFFLVGINSNGK